MADQEKQLDRLLDSLLADYADAEPRPGFETRLLAGVRKPGSTFPFGWMWAGATAVVMAGTLLVMFSSRLGDLPLPPRIPVAGAPVLPAIKPMRVPNVNLQRPKSPPEQLQVASDADLRQEVFPTPVPLSEQEKLMLQYLRGTPREEVASQAHEDEPAEKGAPFVPESQRINGAEVFNTR